MLYTQEQLQATVMAHDLLLKFLIERTPVEVRQEFGRYVESFRDRAMQVAVSDSEIDLVEAGLRKMR